MMMMMIKVMKNQLQQAKETYQNSIHIYQLQIQKVHIKNSQDDDDYTIYTMCNINK